MKIKSPRFTPTLRGERETLSPAIEVVVKVVLLLPCGRIQSSFDIVV